ncbi:biopolymer transporter ExbD [bacterium]|nr:biopolymer transporter ExbD [bacterium]
MLLERKKKHDARIPTSSQADIAFLLLTFFLVTTSLNVDKGLMSTLPPRGEPKPIPRKNIADIFINAGGQVALDIGDGLQPVSIGNVKDIIKQRLAVNENLIVSIKTDRETKYQVFINVLDQVQIAYGGKPRISIAEPES